MVGIDLLRLSADVDGLVPENGWRGNMVCASGVRIPSSLKAQANGLGYDWHGLGEILRDDCISGTWGPLCQSSRVGSLVEIFCKNHRPVCHTGFYRKVS